MIVCPHCGRTNDAGAYCGDCGKPLPGAGRASKPVPDARCPACGHGPLDARLPFCPACGAHVTADGAPRTAVFTAKRSDTGGAVLILLDDTGQPASRHPLAGAETTVGRVDADIAFPDDPFLSPVHAQLSMREGRYWLRDLGSRNGTWYFLESAYRLQDGDLILVGSQVIRYRRLGYPGPNPPEADATRRLGSLIPSADIASLTQLRADGSARDTVHLSPGRVIKLGRERGDWIFPYDPSMSGTHCEIRSEDADFILADDGSRNGVAVSVRAEVELRRDSRLLVGDKMLKLETA